jgi:hypothetical protein
MKASELIQKLALLIAKHGDLPVKTNEYGGAQDTDITEVFVPQDEVKFFYLSSPSK